MSLRSRPPTPTPLTFMVASSSANFLSSLPWKLLRSLMHLQQMPSTLSPCSLFTVICSCMATHPMRSSGHDVTLLPSWIELTSWLFSLSKMRFCHWLCRLSTCVLYLSYRSFSISTNSTDMS